MSMFKTLSIALAASSVVLAGCNAMSNAGQSAKDKYHEMTGKSSSQESVDPAAQPADTMTHEHGTVDRTAPVQTAPADGTVAPADAAAEESTWDKTKRKAGEAYDSVKQKIK